MKCFKLRKNTAIAEDFRIAHIGSFHESGNRNEIVHKFEVIFSMKLTIIQINRIVQSGFRESPISSSPSAPLSFQVVVLDGRIVNCH